MAVGTQPKPKFRYTSSGALVCDQEIPSVTIKLDDECTRFYEGRYFVAESMTRTMAKKIAEMLGGELV